MKRSLRSRTVRVFVLAMMAASATTAFSAGLERTMQAGGVVGAVTPFNLDDAKAPMIDFEVALDSHSVPLDFEMTRIATLSDGKDLSFSWKWPFGAAPDVKISMDGGSFTDVTPPQLASMLTNKDFFLVNTHIPYAGEIAGTDAFLPYDQTKALQKKYPTEKSAKIVVYCRTGRMSEIAARELVKAGFTNVLNLSGGMVAWEKAGLSLKNKPAEKE